MPTRNMKCERRWLRIFKVSNHNFEDWKKIDEGIEDASTPMATVTKFWIRQRRICKECGFIEDRIDTIFT